MKRRTKKLVLSKETLRALSNREVAFVWGGVSFSDCYSCELQNPCEDTFNPEPSRDC